MPNDKSQPYEGLNGSRLVLAKGAPGHWRRNQLLWPMDSDATSTQSTYWCPAAPKTPMAPIKALFLKNGTPLSQTHRRVRVCRPKVSSGGHDMRSKTARVVFPRVAVQALSVAFSSMGGPRRAFSLADRPRHAYCGSGRLGHQDPALQLVAIGQCLGPPPSSRAGPPEQCPGFRSSNGAICTCAFHVQSPLGLGPPCVSKPNVMFCPTVLFGSNS